MLNHHQTTGTICHLRPKWNSLCRHVAIWGSLRSGSWHPTVKGKFALVMHHEPGRSQGMLHPSDRKKKSTKKWWLQNAQGVQKWIYGYQWLYIKWIKMMALKKNDGSKTTQNNPAQWSAGSWILTTGRMSQACTDYDPHQQDAGSIQSSLGP